MKRINFTADRIAGFKCEPGKPQTIYWDARAPGLGLRVTPSGKKAFVFETKLNNKTMRVTIGDTRVWSIGKAQGEATRLKALTDQGIDPRMQKQESIAAQEAEQAAAKRKEECVAIPWAAYLNHFSTRWKSRHMTDHVNLSQKGGEVKKRGKNLTVQGVIYPVLQMRLADITPESLCDWVSDEAETRANNARQGFEMFRCFWRWLAKRPEYKGLIDPHIVDDDDLRAEVPSRKNKRFDLLQRAHLASWFMAVQALDNLVISAYLQALLLTGARREEMASLRWDDVDFRWSAMWVKDKVVEEGRQIPLTPYLASLLAALPRRNEWVFSSPNSATGRIMEPRKAHNRALASAGLDHVTLHGLRRTFASLAEWVEIPGGVVAQIMGHAPTATAEKHYINRPLELLFIWHSKYEAWILEQAKIAFTVITPALKLVA